MCQTPELPVVGCLVPDASPSPTPSATPSPATEQVVHPQPVVAAPPAVNVVPAVAVVAAPQPVLPAIGPGPAVASPTPQAVVPVVAPSTAATASPQAAGVPLTSVVPSAYAIVVFGLIGVALLASFLSGLRPTPAPVGGTMKRQRTRLWTGLGVIAAAAVVGGIGWYKIAGEPALNRQIPLLASAGIAVVVLAVVGGALIIAEQLRTDQHRIGELENAVRALTDALSPLVEQPARRQASDALVQ